MTEGAYLFYPGAHLHAVFFREVDFFGEPGEGVGNGYRVVQGTEGVHHHVQSGLGHLLSYVVCKAAAYNKDFVRIGNLDLASFKNDGGY